MLVEQKPQFQTIDDKLLVRAPAKLNLSLLIAGKRADGYHTIETIMAKINLYDELYFSKTDSPNIEFECIGKYAVEADENNLVIKACKLLGISKGLRVKLVKNIPAGAGLAGGSSDAAATLLGLNKLFNLGLSTQHLSELAAKIGSDIPFFLGDPLAFCSGRGEKIKKFDKKFDFKAVLFIPHLNSSTKRVYENYKHNQEVYLSYKKQILEFLLNNNIDLLAKICANMLQCSCFALYSQLADFKNKADSLAIGNICLSGSGSSMFAIVEKFDIIDIEKIKTELSGIIDCDIVLVSNSDW
jgi:4-diphosphocytidyl-2-C-methyl-D-erythritol kinase